MDVGLRPLSILILAFVPYFSLALLSCPVCLYSTAGLLLYSQPSGEEYAESGGGRRDRHGERTPRTGPHWH